MNDRQYYEDDSPWIELPQLDWTELTAGHRVSRLARGYIFYTQQEYCDKIYVIKRGRVAMCLCTPEGNMRVTMVLDRGCAFGYYSIWDGIPNSCQAEIVSDDAEVYVLPKEEATGRIQGNPVLTNNLLLESIRINRMLITQIELVSFRRSESRVCFYLLHMARQYSETKDGKNALYMRFTHQNIAEVTGLSRVSVSNIISGLVKDKILGKKDGYYYVIRMDALRERVYSDDMTTAE